MSKAEKFIQDYTRNCSNELCSEEDRFGKKVISYYEWLTPDQARRAIEIAREEMIEKVSIWLKMHTCMFQSIEEVDLFNQLLIKAMKDE